MTRERFTVGRQEFVAEMDSRTNTRYVHSIHPYDETEYHWARRSAETGHWIIYLNGRKKAVMSKVINEKEIAAILLDMDRQAGLKRTGGIW